MTIQRAASLPLSSPCFLLENHDEAYWIWRENHLQDCPLFHFDAHIDISWISPDPSILLTQSKMADVLSKSRAEIFWDLRPRTFEEKVDLGNYIQQAIQDGIVSEFVWIYPDAPRRTKQIHAVRHILKEQAISSSGWMKWREDPSGIFSGTLFGKPFKAFPFSHLSSLQLPQDILLDIDIDFFTTQHLDSRYYPYSDPHRPQCWLSPKHFVEELCRGCHLDRYIATIAHSVEEGYTPLPLKFLGQEISKRLAGTLTESEEEVCSFLYDLWSHGLDEKTGSALQAFADLLQKEPAKPELEFNLAWHLLEQNRIEDAKPHYERATRLDPAYRTDYNHPGPIWWNLGKPQKAAASYHRALCLDPHHPGSRIFEIKEELTKHRFKRALEKVRECLEDGIDQPELHLLRAQAYLGLGEFEKAWDEIQRVEIPWKGQGRDASRYLSCRGHIALKLKRWEEALSDFKQLQLFTLRDPRLQWILTGLYFRRRNFYKARRHFLKWLAALFSWFFKPWVKRKRLQKALR